VGHRRWIGILVGVACSLVSLVDLEHSISWSIAKHGKVLAITVIFNGTFFVVFALLAIAAFLWSRSASKSTSSSN
jgi:hypothetical protein